MLATVQMTQIVCFKRSTNLIQHNKQRPHFTCQLFQKPFSWSLVDLKRIAGGFSNISRSSLTRKSSITASRDGFKINLYQT